MKKFIINWIISIIACIYHYPFRSVLYVPRFLWDYYSYKNNSDNEKVSFFDTYPCLINKTISTPIQADYFYQGAWVARRLSAAKPAVHVDVGSSVLMLSVLSASIKTIFIDYRPLNVKLSDLVSVGADITQLPFGDNTIASLSCLHVIEHVGLGRYGDPVDVEGTIKSAKELERVLSVGGLLYVSLPVGRERVCYNAHRVLSPNTVVSYFPALELISFSYVNDADDYVENGDLESVENNSYACGMYIFKKT
jgi:hypothetical protein